ncbi:hypothetical protein BCR39DRAFT_376804 [Naematelia encephala]|uniref:Cyclin N-terminal domain-containing protein n=1 Tax=Naematelia encephala TaxID=71784 RepID=A0A1Y2BCI8_9TREE|nr:hypothetical protein BCR39DRAFT_376804 [Naematelia encephala]
MPFLYDYAAPDAVSTEIQSAKWRAARFLENVPVTAATEANADHQRWQSQSSGATMLDVPPPVVPTYAQPVDHATAYRTYMQLDASRFPPDLAIPDHILRTALPPVSPSCVNPNAQPTDYPVRNNVMPDKHAPALRRSVAQEPMPQYHLGTFPLVDGDLLDTSTYNLSAPPNDDCHAHELNTAMSQWYCEEILKLLVRPGYYRPGAGGASEEIWGPSGREKDEWMRVSRSSEHWRVMAASVQLPRPHRVSNPREEGIDPWCVSWRHHVRPDPDFVYFVSNAMTRMTVSPTAAVAALWYIRGLGLHPGDGVKGAEIRAILKEQSALMKGGVEKRIAILGLLLAGKWLDDNSYLRKSWTEVTNIPLKDIGRLEIAALKDLHFSLHLPLPAWTKHIDEAYYALVAKPVITESDHLVLRVLHAMIGQAQTFATYDTDPVESQFASMERRSSQELPAAGDQAISRAWGEFAQNYAIDGYGQPPAVLHSFNPTPNRIRAATIAGPSKAFNQNQYDDVVMDEDEEFVEYDGAKPFPVPETLKLGRSGSGSSSRSLFGAIGDQRGALPHGCPYEESGHVDYGAQPTYCYSTANPHGQWSLPSMGYQHHFVDTVYPEVAQQSVHRPRLLGFV